MEFEQADLSSALLRMTLFRTRFAAVRKSTFKHRDEVALTEVLPALNEGLPLDDVFSNAQATELFEALVEEGIVMLEGGVVVRFDPPSRSLDFR